MTNILVQKAIIILRTRSILLLIVSNANHTNNEATRPEQHSVWVNIISYNCVYDVDRRIVMTRYVTPWNAIQVPLFREVRMITTCTEIVIHGPVPATIDNNCPMIVLSESLPDMDGMTYITENQK